MFLKILNHDNISNLIAALSLVLAGYTTWASRRFEKKQRKTNIEINDLILRKEKKELSKESMADVSANFILLGNNNRKLKIFNKGNALARNVNIIFPDGNEIIPDYEINEKLPIKLERHQNVELIAITHMNMPRKIKCLISWEDDHSMENKKEIELTL